MAAVIIVLPILAALRWREQALLFVIFGVFAVIMFFVIGQSNRSVAEYRESRSNQIRDDLQRFLKFLGRGSMIGLYVGGHPRLTRRTPALVELRSDSVRLTPARLSGSQSDYRLFELDPDDVGFESALDRELSVDLPYVDIEFIENSVVTKTSMKKKNPVARAVVGGLIAGGVGAVVGAASGLKEDEISSTSVQLVITYRRSETASSQQLILGYPTPAFIAEARRLFRDGDPDLGHYEAGFKPFLTLLMTAKEEHDKREKTN
jgi:hypothetical protein